MGRGYTVVQIGQAHLYSAKSIKLNQNKGEERRKFKESKEGQRIWDRHYVPYIIVPKLAWGLHHFFSKTGERMVSGVSFG